MAAPNSQSSELGLAAALAAGIGRQNVALFVNLANLTNAITVGFVPGFKGRLISYSFVALLPSSTASKDATLTAKVETTAMTGGVLALLTAGTNAAGETTDATAITALNAFSATQALNFTIAVSAVFIEGNGWLLLRIINDDTIEALANALGGYRTP